MKSQFLSVGGVLINRELSTIKFTCDLTKCKGACCTLESEFGAPIREDEIPLMENSIDAAKKYLPAEHREELEKNGFYEVKNGDYLTRSLNNKACLLVYYDDGIAKCALEKAFFNGESSFRKPVSCHLFPIRISDFGGDILRYETFSECAPALELGKKTGTSIVRFCHESLTRNYGKEWYNELTRAAEEE
ncbi:MAG: DUF3109 family protein [Ignavibacteria bacterium]|nr:DUF3109 family protein [Ignavibacteria bacterium]